MPRVQIDMTEQQFEELDELMREANLIKKKDLFNNALTLFEWAVGERKKGNLIASVSSDGKGQVWRELQMPILSRVKKKIDSDAG